jgi:hypothetical protein
MASLKKRTKPVRALITTDDYEIQGCLHIRVGGQHSRISDMLNNRESKFIPITDAIFLGVNNPEGQPRHVETMILRIDSIKAIVPDADEERKATEEARAEGLDGDIAASNWK